MSRGVHLYRKLFRTINQTFAGDLRAGKGARAELRKQFVASRGLADEAAIQEQLAIGREAEEFIRTCIVQARRAPTGQYVVDADKAPKLQEVAAELSKTTRP